MIQVEFDDCGSIFLEGRTARHQHRAGRIELSQEALPNGEPLGLGLPLICDERSREQDLVAEQPSARDQLLQRLHHIGLA